MTKIGEKGLNAQDIKERDSLSDQLEKAFSEVEQSINKYQQRVDEINGWLIEMREKFQAYYDDRSGNWQQSKDGGSSVYDESIKNDWDNFRYLEGFEDQEEMRDLLETWVSDLKKLPKRPDRRTKATPLFTRKL
jgi:hypothetical protein